METRYMYEVRPKRPIKIPGKPPIVRPCSIQLTKEEVKEYMTKATIYRRFVDGSIERVTGANLNLLHSSEKKEPAVARPTAPEVRKKEKPDWKQNKHNKGNKSNNYHSDDRGKTSVNNQIPEFPYQQEPTNSDSGKSSESGNAFADL